MESPAAGLSTWPRARALHVAGSGKPRRGESAPRRAVESPAAEAPWRVRPPGSPRGQGRRALHKSEVRKHDQAGKPARRGNCGEPGGGGAVESPAAGFSIGPRARALHMPKAHKCDQAGESARRGNCGEPGGGGAVESPAAGFSTGPRARALHSGNALHTPHARK